MGANVLVTGGAGFIGLHTAQALKNHGHNVHVIDCFSPYYSVQLKQDRASILHAQHIPIEIFEMQDRAALEAYVKKHAISHIVHLAAQAGVRHSLVDPESYLRANIDGFVSLLETVRKNPEIKVVYASSSSVYGNNEKVPFSEEDRTDFPANLYGATKKSNELFAYAYHHLFQLKLIGLRFFTVYGPWGRPDMAYYLFAKAIKENQGVSIFGDGTDRRDFTYINDIVEGIIAALFSPIDFGVYNLGNSFPETVNYLIDCLSKSFGKKALVRYEQKQAGDMAVTYANIDKAEKDFGFRPKTHLAEGIESFVSWCKTYHRF